jgi:hypothetical protein
MLGLSIFPMRRVPSSTLQPRNARSRMRSNEQDFSARCTSCTVLDVRQLRDVEGPACLRVCSAHTIELRAGSSLAEPTFEPTAQPRRVTSSQRLRPILVLQTRQKYMKELVWGDAPLLVARRLWRCIPQNQLPRVNCRHSPYPSALSLRSLHCPREYWKIHIGHSTGLE